ncbi:MAG: cystathionine beta-lyase [Betaproteobacteria bacterium]|nr:cystathionine beta-lyase [Betaproteobacteria bacterium]NCX43648.1 cystathionine beta-lyase [Betaproteobacteria bacterium]NCX71998.1 cystathionine beta-lyase [Betaproteobacteria bacterium]NCZ46119.1 cystathionine beta-lyase [Betaproteobacteria bacterium]NCZ81605.1 cystathionine beta-lyase [Betaproteobacteria bacterium]
MMLKPDTLPIDVARVLDSDTRVANIPVYRASTVLFASLDEAVQKAQAVARGDKGASTYATASTPTTAALMDALEQIEGAGHATRACLAPSGLSAIATLLMALLKPGDDLLVIDSVYGPTRNFCQSVLAQWGVSTRFYRPDASAEALEAMLLPNTRLIYLESPASYTFEIQDVPAIAAMAKRRGVLTVIDNAWASPMMANPFDWGVDASVLPLTKYWSGHSDVLMGASVVREALWPALWKTQRDFGVCVGGDDAYLVLRGLRTAAVRMRQHEQSALSVARWLEQRPGVARVIHPALDAHPQHALFKRDFKGSSGLFGFVLDRSFWSLGASANGPEDPQTARLLAAMCEGRRHFGMGYSWGGYESLIMPARLSALRSVEPWCEGPLLRVHMGLEDPQDLIEDLEAGFQAMARIA